MLEIEVATHVDAAPARVWDLIGDPTRMGEWSPECRSLAWKGASSGPALGATFSGHNRNGWRRWTTTCTIVSFEPGSQVGWDVRAGTLPVARWSYRVEPDAGGSGCTVVESFSDHRGRVITALGTLARGVKDVEAHNRRGMEATLSKVKAAAEGNGT